MNEHEHDEALDRRGEPADDGVGELLRRIGPRPEVPELELARIEVAARDTWQHVVRSRQLRRRALYAGLVLAASALLVVVGTRWLAPRAPAAVPTEVASVERVLGSAEWRSGDESAVELAEGQILRDGDGVATGAEGRAVLSLTSPAGVRVSLRLDRLTELRFVGPSVLELERGAVYIDSGLEQGIPAQAVEVRTPFGIARDVGTQFEASLRDAGFRVRVRRGTVLLERDGETHRATAGIELRVSADGSLTRTDAPVAGPDWQWVLDTAPGFDLEGRTVQEFLTWVSRETGWQVRFADPSVEASIAGEVLHGSIHGLSPDAAPAVVLPSAGLSSRTEGGTLIVEQGL